MKRLLHVAGVLFAVVSATADVGEQSRWRSDAVGWWIAQGYFNPSGSTEPWFGAYAVASNGLSEVVTSGARGILFDGLSGMLRVPSTPRLNFASQSDAWTPLVQTNLNHDAIYTDGTNLYMAYSGRGYKFDQNGNYVTNYPVPCGHCDQADRYLAGTNTFLITAGGISDTTNAIVYLINTTGVQVASWNFTANNLTDIWGAASIASNQVILLSYGNANYSNYLSCVYLGAAGAYSVAWSSNLPAACGIYSQGMCGWNGHAYGLFDNSAADSPWMPVVWDFAITSNGYNIAQSWSFYVPGGEAESEGLTIWKNQLVFGMRSNMYATAAWPVPTRRQITLAAWVLKSANGNGNLVSKFHSAAGARSWAMSLISGQEGMYLRDTNDTYCFSFTPGVGGPVYPVQQWHHQVLTWDGTFLQGYLDGNLTWSSMGGGVILGTSTDVTIGNFADTAQYFQGALHDVLVFSRALTAAEVKALYLQTQ